MLMNNTPEKLVFFLGGRDLEMITIRDLLGETSHGGCHDKALSWGARASDYSAEIAETIAAGRTPVLIELENDLELREDEFINIDHHGARAGREAPTSLHQVFALLDLPADKWTRWHKLVAANDRGYIPEMLAEGATPEEIRQVRAADRQAQGITEAEEIAAEESLKQIETVADGRLTIVRLPHSRTAAVSDRLEPALGGPGYQNLAIISPSSINFYGSGRLILALADRFPGGWYGGALPERGFWGINQPAPNVLPFIRQSVRADHEDID